MQTITTIGFDIAKSVFQVHGVDAVGEVVRRHRTPGLGARQFFKSTQVHSCGTEFGAGFSADDVALAMHPQ